MSSSIEMIHPSYGSGVVPQVSGAITECQVAPEGRCFDNLLKHSSKTQTATVFSEICGIKGIPSGGLSGVQVRQVVYFML